MKDYGEFWGIAEIFETFGSGVKTERDRITIQFTNTDIQEVINDFKKLPESELKEIYDTYDTRDWKVNKAKEDVLSVKDKNFYAMIHYRPFDFRWTFYTGKTRGFIGTPGYKVAKDFLKGKNPGLLFMRQVVLNTPYLHFLITDKISDSRILYSSQGIASAAPLYLYQTSPETKYEPINVKHVKKTVNFTKEFQNFIKTKYHPRSPDPEQILGYIYAVMYCPVYRQTYLEFLKIDFPRIPFADNYDTFGALSELGTELIEHHLLKKSYPDNQVSFPREGDDIVEQVRFVCDKNTQTGNIFINKKQYFKDIPIHSWKLYIGGYPVLDKWLKSRKGRVLTYQEKEHFKKIVNSLNFTGKCMYKIEKLWRTAPYASS